MVMRTQYCGEVNESLIGRQATVVGWVHRRRDHGGVIFIDLRDREGVLQVVFNPDDAATFALAESVRSEFVLQVEGEVRARPEGTVNPGLATGQVELVARRLAVLNRSETPPFHHDEAAGEDLRLRYRYLDLRRPEMLNNLRLRHRVTRALRSFLDAHGFVDVETPILTKATPEGARDYLVPARNFPGRFYALPQSPQLFKQLLMMSGLDRYYQIARCFRDEDLRADRQPEFTQLDVETSFMDEAGVTGLMEAMVRGLFREVLGVELPDPFPRMRWAEAVERFGTDRPDLRNPLIISDVTDIFADTDFTVFRKNIEKGAVVRAIPGPNCGSRAVCDRMNSWAQGMGAPGMGYIMFAEGEGRGPIAKFLSPEKLADLKQRTGLGDGDAVFFACDKPLKAAQLAGQARTKLGQDLDLLEKNVFRLCWIVDFPMFELDEETGKIEFSHNPFSMPQGGKEALETMDPLDILAYQYDVVCNGVELSSGAIRNHRPDIMKKAFEIAGYSEAVVEAKFPALWNAFHYGAPPHGGIAPGIDRIVMLLANEPNIREVILFPMNQKAEDLLMGAPSEATPAQLRELNLRPLPPRKEG